MAAGRSPKLAELSGGKPLSPKLVHEAALAGDRAAREVIEAAGHHLGLGLAGLLNCFNPECLILGGGLTALGEMYLEPALKTARSLAFEQVVSDATISLANLGDAAGALGAAALMMDASSR